MTTPPEDDFTELRDADIPRVDLVDKAANGMRFLIAKQADGRGLMDPDFVRGLVAKAEPEPIREEQVTMTGSPAAIAKMIHEAAQRQATQATELTHEQLVKAKYDTDDLKRMAANGQAMEDESYPIVDREDLENAIHAVGRGGADHDAIRRHIERRAKALGATSMIPDNWAADGSLKKESAVADEDMDPTAIIAEPDDIAPGNPTTPGSPAWESIDAATARKWTAILARARAAIDLLADRELMEAASGADPDDAGQAYDLQDACCAIDYAISVLAPFAVAEQAEADCGEEMAAVGKALVGFDSAQLDTIEALGHVRKAGRVLSSANEAAIRGAVESLQKVLASLPAAPTAEEGDRAVAKTANEEPTMPTSTTSADTTAASGQEPAMGTAETAPQQPAGIPVSEPEPVGKADEGKTPMVAVYDAKGKLVGIVDPGEITPISGADASDESDDGSSAEDDAPDTSDLTPAPPAEAGTPADAVPDDDVNKTTTPTPTPDTSTSETVAKSSITDAVRAELDAYSATQGQVIAKQAADLAQMAKNIEELTALVKTLEEQPATPKVFTNGAVPPRDLRGMDHGTTPIDAARAQELKKTLYGGGTAAEQNQAANELQQMSITRLQEIQRP
ncbi:MAG: hypothetical protein HOW97_09575 [Catenulispora sp.]|nr:hypothetical protein [Catenulispora sp.]